MTAARVAFAAVLAAAMPSVAFADSDSRAASRAVGDAAPGVLAQTELDVAPAGKRITRVEVEREEEVQEEVEEASVEAEAPAEVDGAADPERGGE